MKDQISVLTKNFISFYQKTLLRRTLVGIITGIFLWLFFFVLANFFNLLIDENTWWDTFLYDLPLLGTILALLVTFQIWGLLPQPTNDNTLSIESSSKKKMNNLQRKNNNLKLLVE
ncbi:MAG: hypothetical protein ACFE98_04870 [Candidatus Hermodarchaeota archaeon]